MPKVRKLSTEEVHTLGWDATGLMAADDPDDDDVYQRAVREATRTKEYIQARASQRLTFTEPMVMLALVGDQHLGSPGTDVERCFEEAQLIADTPGMRAATIGDALDSFVIGRLRQARDNSRLGICDEWALVKRYFRLLAPKLCVSVAGNHDQWAHLLIGVDYFREVLAGISPYTIYDTDDCKLDLVVNGVSFPGRLRHQWQGHSIYNITHGIERAAKWDQNFRWGVGGHTHESGVVRTFNAAGNQGVACLVGSYKRYDSFAKRLGFPQPNQSTGVAILFDSESGTMTGFDNLYVAAKIWNHLQRAGGSAT